MTKEDNERTEKAFNEVVSYHSSIPLISKDYFKAGVEFGKREGFNEGIEAALKVLRENDTVPKSWAIDEIEKLKNPS